MFTRYLVLAAAICLLSPLASAEKFREACKEDIKTFCTDKGIKPGGGRILSCLKAQEANLSSGCSAAMAEGKQKMKDCHAACKGDIQTHCKVIPPCKGRILSCLKTKEDSLTSECKTAMSSR